MPVMSALEGAFCRSRAWGWFAGRVVLPWALDGLEFRGDVLELGAGAGAMAGELLARFPSIRVTVTDVVPAMLEAARRRLAVFGNRIDVRQADATRLSFPDGHFDAVVSFAMLHHVVDWEQALSEAARVLRPGGTLAGYDLIHSGPTLALHRFDRSSHRLATVTELTERLAELPMEDHRVEPRLGGLAARFAGRRSAT